MKQVRIPNRLIFSSFLRTEAGFTLLELILVILIMAVLAGLSIPMFRRTFTDLQLTQSCSDLIAVSNYARQSAVFNRNEYQLKLDLDKSEFWIQEKVLQDDNEDFKRIEGRFGRVYSLPEGIKIDSDKDHLTFYPDGRSDAVTITIDSGVKIYTFTTEGTTVYVKVLQQ